MLNCTQASRSEASDSVTDPNVFRSMILAPAYSNVAKIR